MQGYLRRKVTYNLGKGFNPVDSPRLGLFARRQKSKPLAERAEIYDYISPIGTPADIPYCEQGADEGWLKYIGHHRDRHGVCHRYLLLSPD